MSRALLIITTLTGGVGLGLALGYLLLVIAAFSPEGGSLTTFLVGSADGDPQYGFTLVLIPYALLLLHMWLRVRVGAILLDRGDIDRAVQFASQRLGVNLMRARREVLANRIVLMRAAVMRGDYDQAAEVARAADLPTRGARVALVEFHRWELEAALRGDDLIEARRVVDHTWPFAVQGAAGAAFCACAGELAIRNGDRATWEDWVERAEFARSGCERLQISRAFAACRFGDEPGSLRELAMFLETPLEWLRDVPGARGEIVAVRASLLASAGDVALARESLSQPDGQADARSRHVLSRVASEIDAREFVTQV